MAFRSRNLLIGTIALATIGASFGGVIGYQRFSRVKQLVPFHVVFEGSASGLRQGASVNFAGVRVGEVRSLKLDHPRRVVAMALIDPNTPLRADTQVGLEFQGLTGIAAISFTGGTIDGPPPPVDAEGIRTLTADRDGTLTTQEKIRVALRNVDKVITENESAVKDTLLGLESFTSTLAGSGNRITSVMDSAESAVATVDNNFGKTYDFLKTLGSDKYGGELLPTIVSFRELVESFNKKSATLITDTRKMLGDLSASINKSDPRPPRR
ncbi:MAG: MlaD family protein [Bradyrhizobium sp.]|nr:MlaD family protein [Bradyrhizobium sp.]